MRKIFFVITALIFFSCSGKKEKRAIIFNRIDNLSKNAEVKMLGVPIGKVINCSLVDSGVLVEIKLNSKKEIPGGSTATIINPFIGPAYINIEPSKSNYFLTEKDTIIGLYEDVKILDKMLSDTITKRKIEEAFDKINKRIN
jgi:ABC-type transporter Mla subunit MlaD